MNITDDEKRVIEILVDFGPAADPHTAPLHAVSKAMGWDSTHTTTVVKDLVNCNLIRANIGPFKRQDSGDPTPKAHWSWERT